jgi:biotin carboxylase
VLLLLPTRTYRARDFMEAAYRLGVEVVVGSERQQAFAPLFPGGHLRLDFLRPRQAVRTIEAFARSYPLDAVVAVDDDGTMLAAAAAKALELPHNPVMAVAATRNKHRLRRKVAAAGLLSPRFERLSVEDDPVRSAQRMPFPCVLKPLHLAASRGVMRADDAKQFVAVFERLVAILRTPDVVQRGSRLARHVLVEAFIPGTEVALEGLLVGGELTVLAVFDKPDPLDGPFFEETLYVTPSRLPADVQADLAAQTAKAVAAIGLREGPVHAEWRVNGHGAWLLEIAARSIGGLCSRALRFGVGVSLEDLILMHASGAAVETCERERAAAGVMMLPIPRRGVLHAVDGQEAARRVPGIVALTMTIAIGQEVVPLPEGVQYLGFLFARGDTPEAVEASLRRGYQCLSFTIGPSTP